MYVIVFFLLLVILGLTGYYLYKKGVFDFPKNKEVIDNGAEQEDERIFKTEKGVTFSLLSPLPNSTVNCEFQITGEMPSEWFFEGTFPYEIRVGGKLVYEGSVHTEDDWTENPILRFTTDVNCGDGCMGKGEIVLKNANPSGLKENEDSYTIPVTFSTICAVELSEEK